MTSTFLTRMSPATDAIEKHYPNESMLYNCINYIYKDSNHVIKLIHINASMYNVAAEIGSIVMVLSI